MSFAIARPVATPASSASLCNIRGRSHHHGGAIRDGWTSWLGQSSFVGPPPGRSVRHPAQPALRIRRADRRWCQGHLRRAAPSPRRDSVTDSAPQSCRCLGCFKPKRHDLSKRNRFGGEARSVWLTKVVHPNSRRSLMATDSRQSCRSAAADVAIALVDRLAEQRRARRRSACRRRDGGRRRGRCRRIRAAGRADDQAGRAVVALAVIATVRAAIDLVVGAKRLRSP